MHKPEKSITICPLTWKDARRKDSLSDWSTGVKVIDDGKPLQLATSIPSTSLHELCHMTSNEKETEVKDKTVSYQGKAVLAYGPTLGAALALASPCDAFKNADSYRWFATAMYPDGYNWSRTIASGVPVANPERANATSTEDGKLGNSRRFKRKAASERRQINWFEDETI